MYKQILALYALVPDGYSSPRVRAGVGNGFPSNVNRTAVESPDGAAPGDFDAVTGLWNQPGQPPFFAVQYVEGTLFPCPPVRRLTLGNPCRERFGRPASMSEIDPFRSIVPKRIDKRRKDALRRRTCLAHRDSPRIRSNNRAHFDAQTDISKFSAIRASRAPPPIGAKPGRTSAARSPLRVSSDRRQQS